MNLYDRVFPPKVIVLPNGKNVTKPRSRAPLAAAVLLALTVLSVKVTGFDMSLLARRIKEFFVILGQMILTMGLRFRCLPSYRNVRGQKEGLWR